jgi:hypothetical protein
MCSFSQCCSNKNRCGPCHPPCTCPCFGCTRAVCHDLKPHRAPLPMLSTHTCNNPARTTPPGAEAPSSTAQLGASPATGTACHVLPASP